MQLWMEWASKSRLSKDERSRRRLIGLHEGYLPEVVGNCGSREGGFFNSTLDAREVGVRGVRTSKTPIWR